MSSSTGGSLSSVPNGRIIDFERAELRKLPFQDSLYLWVRGRLPQQGAEVRLAPRVYHERPDFWGIEVTVISTPASGGVPEDNEMPLDYERSVPLTGITGSRGVAVIGANRVKRIEIPGETP